MRTLGALFISTTMVLGSAGAARAQGGEGGGAAPAAQVVVPSTYPTAEIDRPFALRPLVIEVRAGVILDFLSMRRADNQFAVKLEAGFGVFDDLEAGISAPLMFAPEVRMGDLQFYGLYELSSLLPDSLFLATRLDFVIPLSDFYSYWYGADFAMMLNVPFRYKIVGMLAVIAELGMGFGLFPGDDAFLFFVEGGVLVQPIEALALELTIGAHWLAGQNTTALPMRLRGQYTLIGDLDLFFETSFLDLNNWGADWFQVIIGGAFRIGF